MAAIGAQGAGADDHGVGQVAQEAHDQAVGLGAAAQGRAGAAARRQRDHAVQRGDEVGVQQVPGQGQATAVERGQRGRQVSGGLARGLVHQD